MAFISSVFTFQMDGSVPNTLIIANVEVDKPRVAAAEHISEVTLSLHNNYCVCKIYLVKGRDTFLFHLGLCLLGSFCFCSLMKRLVLPL